MRRRHGFVLVAALFLIVALAAVGLDASIRSKSRRLATANLLDETRARAAALAGAEYARSRLSAAMLERADEIRAQASRRNAAARGTSMSAMRRLFSQSDPAEDPWRDPDQLVVQEMAFGAARYALRLRDTGAALNVNSADEEMIRDFFAHGMGLDFARADRLTQAILDWRDEDEIPRVNGAEREEYLRAGLPVLPSNRPFANLDELRHVLGMTPELLEAARPYLTLIGSGRISVNAAPEQVLVALPGLSAAGAAELVRLREAGQLPRNRSELLQLLPAADAAEIQEQVQRFNRRAVYTTSEVEIITEGTVDGSPIRVRTRTVVTRANHGAVVLWRSVE
jgi:general secretion pathway protein K